MYDGSEPPDEEIDEKKGTNLHKSQAPDGGYFDRVKGLLLVERHLFHLL